DLAGTSTSAELAAKGTALLASLTMVLLAALLCNYRRGKCLTDIGTEGDHHPSLLVRRDSVVIPRWWYPQVRRQW
ncbi:MAG TPA: hypothetical protein VK335_26600, partial [Bryobacteraceae bacterium]|nr:hypothetical protein [Bryobacteraceae bacterium]